MPNLSQDFGEAVIIGGIPYRRVGPEQVATSGPQMPTTPGNNDMYNFPSWRLRVADENGKRYWSAAEVAVAFSTANHNRLAPITCPINVKTLIFTAPVGNGGVIIPFTSGGQANIVYYYVDTKLHPSMNGSNGDYLRSTQVGYPNSFNPDMSLHKLDDNAYVSGNEPVFLHPGESFYLKFGQAQYNVYYIWLPAGYP